METGGTSRTVCVTVSAAVFFIFSAAVYAADIGNCLLCHKYPGISRVDQDGNLRLFYVNESIFRNSVHAKVKCEDCHADIKEIPHKPTEKVNCLAECHIVEPSSEKKFSHADVENNLKESIHSKLDRNGVQKQYAEDYPECKDCHENPLYRPLSFFKKLRYGVSQKSLARCKGCHKKEEFIYRFYNHVTARLHRSKNPLNISEICARCHDDEKLVARHNLGTKAVYSYGETFHGKAARYLDERVPDCLDCHVRQDASVHHILSHKDQEASTYTANRGEICSNIDCHPGASPKLASYRVHAEFNLQQNPVQYYFTLFFIILTGGTLLPLMGIIFLDCFRRLFPNAVIKRRSPWKNIH